MCRDTLSCYNSSCPHVTVSEDEIWQRDAAVGKCPVSCGDGKTDIVFSCSVLLKTKLYSVLLERVSHF